MIRLVKTRIDCEHSKETLLAYTAPIFRNDWQYWYGCDECGRVRKFTHRQSLAGIVGGEVTSVPKIEPYVETFPYTSKDDR